MTKSARNKRQAALQEDQTEMGAMPIIIDGDAEPDIDAESLDADAPSGQDTNEVDATPVLERLDHPRLLEALLFASDRPLSIAELQSFFPEDADVMAMLKELQDSFANRGFHLVETAGKWAFLTSADLAPYLRKDKVTPRKLTRATIETLAIIAYHQPVTRAEIEEIRGVSVSQGTLDLLLEAGWVRPGRRRETPGRPVTWISTDAFLQHFGISGLADLPGFDELQALGLLDKKRSAEFLSQLNPIKPGDGAVMPEPAETEEEL